MFVWNCRLSISCDVSFVAVAIVGVLAVEFKVGQTGAKRPFIVRSGGDQMRCIAESQGLLK